MSKEFKIGLLTIIAGALLYYGFNFLRGTNLFSPADQYFVVYPNVAGLNVSNPVYFNGLPVGRVSGFELDQQGARIIVSLDIDRVVSLGKMDTAMLANDGLLGGKAIVLRPGSSREQMNVGDTLKSAIDGDLLSQFEPVADNLNTTITKINTLLDQLVETDLKGVVDTLKYSIGSITRKVNRIDVQPLINNVEEVTASFNDRSKQLDTLLQSSNVLMDSLKAIEYNQLVRNLNETLEGVNQLMGQIQSDQGTIGKLMTNDSIYNSLNKLLVDLDELAIHFNNYPKDFLKPLGRKNKKLKGVSQEGN